eukprot:scaffold223_cov408-Prasinococcus_capsulatus_cf.AAC.8
MAKHPARRAARRAARQRQRQRQRQRHQYRGRRRRRREQRQRARVLRGSGRRMLLAKAELTRTGALHPQAAAPAVRGWDARGAVRVRKMVAPVACAAADDDADGPSSTFALDTSCARGRVAGTGPPPQSVLVACPPLYRADKPGHCALATSSCARVDRRKASRLVPRAGAGGYWHRSSKESSSCAPGLRWTPSPSPARGWPRRR